MRPIPPLSFILYKRLKIEEFVRQKIGAEQRQLNSYKQRLRYGIFKKEVREAKLVHVLNSCIEHVHQLSLPHFLLKMSYLEICLYVRTVMRF